MKKFLICLVVLSLILISCKAPMNMKNVVNEPSFTGIVTEVYDNSILVSVNDGEEVLNSSDLMVVSLDVELKDSMTTFNIGDEVTVYFDGTIAESYPAQINKVYAIVLVDSN